MSKKLIEVSEELTAMAQKIAKKLEYDAKGLTLEVLGLKTSKKEWAKICKATEIIEYFAQDENLILLYIYERAFDMVDDQTKELLLESMLCQVSVDLEKDKVEINAPMITFPISMFHEYGDIIVQKTELMYHTIAQIIESDKAEKDARKAEQALRKKMKNSKN